MPRPNREEAKAIIFNQLKVGIAILMRGGYTEEEIASILSELISNPRQTESKVRETEQRTNS